MKIIKLYFLLLLLSSYSYSQSFFAKFGKNFTNYSFDFRYPDGSKFGSLQMDTGSFYEIGFEIPFKATSRFSYQFGIAFDELNSLVGEPSASVTYKTEYIGLNNGVLFSFIKSKRFIVDARLGFTLSTMIFGKQNIEGKIYDLKQYSEFNGLFFRPFVGGQLKFIASKQLAIGLGVENYFAGFNTNVTNQSLFFNNKQYNLGFYYTIDKVVLKKDKSVSRHDKSPYLNF
jgi:hypothetical protein